MFSKSKFVSLQGCKIYPICGIKPSKDLRVLAPNCHFNVVHVFMFGTSHALADYMNCKYDILNIIINKWNFQLPNVGSIVICITNITSACLWYLFWEILTLTYWMIGLRFCEIFWCWLFVCLICLQNIDKTPDIVTNFESVM